VSIAKLPLSIPVLLLTCEIDELSSPMFAHDEATRLSKWLLLRTSGQCQNGRGGNQRHRLSRNGPPVGTKETKEVSEFGDTK
jgi:hypothetical protein